MPQELFNGSVKTSLNDGERIASGVPGQVGSNNITYGSLKSQILSDFVRSAGNVAIVAGSQDITFSSDFGTTDYSLQVYDINGVGVGVTAQDTDKFTIESLGSGVINYIAIKNI